MTIQTQAAAAHPYDSYVDSHKAPGKGEEYEAYYSSDHEMKYLWQQERRVLSRILEDFFAEGPANLLDFACGTGRISGFLENRVTSSCAIDVSDSMIEIARKKLTRTKLLKLNLLEESPLPKGSFNLITAFRFFLNAEPELRLAAMRALEPLLASEGWFVFNIHQNRHSTYYWPSHLYCRIRHAEPFVTMSVGECEKILGQVGLKIARVYPVGLLHLPKLHFSDRTRRSVDEVAMGFNAMGRISDSPIIVAGKK